MIKKLHEITLKDIILLDATKNARSLKRYWFTPLWLFHARLEKLTKEIFDSIGGKTIDNLQDEFDKLNSFRRLQKLEALCKAVKIEFELRPRINAWKIILEKDYKDSDQLKNVIEAVKEHTGIEIKEPKDLKEFYDYVEHKIAKYREMFPEEEMQEGVKLTKVIYSVFNYMSEPYNESMRLITFVELKAMAEERIKQSRNGEESRNSAN
jgi:hypothetical protein